MIAALVLALFGCGGGGGGVTSPEFARVELEQGSYQLVNAERVATGVEPTLQRQPLLDRLAREHSEAMRDEGFFSHESPSGGALRQRLVTHGYRFAAAGENIARVSGVGDPVGYAHRLLMESPEHRDNILGSGYREVGVGVAIEGGTVWITQIYARPR